MNQKSTELIALIVNKIKCSSEMKISSCVLIGALSVRLTRNMFNVIIVHIKIV